MITSRDTIDAEYIRDVFAAARRWEKTTGKPIPRKPLREVLWFVWQQPRLGRCIRGKYPIDGPWTAEARAAYKTNPKCDLVIDHVEPIKHLIQRLLLSEETTDELITTLTASSRFCVITKDENKRITNAGMSHADFDASDPWGRYRAAGIDAASISPLEDS